MSHAESVAIIVATLCRYRILQKELGPTFQQPIRGIRVSERATRDADAIVTDALTTPVWHTLRGIVREEGWRLFADGGVEGMRKVSEEVLRLIGNEDRRSESTLNKWWGGVGSFESRWLA